MKPRPEIESAAKELVAIAAEKARSFGPAGFALGADAEEAFAERLAKLIAQVRDNEASAIVALTKASARADAAEDTAASAFDGMRVAKNRAEAAEARVRELEERLPRYIPVERLEAAEAALAKEREARALVGAALNESVGRAKVMAEDLCRAESLVAALTEKLEAAKRLTAPHLQEYALRLEDENKALTEKLRVMTEGFGAASESDDALREELKKMTEKARVGALLTRSADALKYLMDNTTKNDGLDWRDFNRLRGEILDFMGK